jgi:Tfp pilus assembly protein PilN
MTARKKEISLLPVEEFEKTRLGRFLKWALTFGRWIVITTELLVILCFLSRFKLDRELTDLGERIKQQQAIISSFGELEKDFRNLQKRLVEIGDLEKKQFSSADRLDEVAEMIPLDVSLKEWNVKGEKIEISAVVLSEAGLGSLMREFSESRFKNVRVENVNKKETGEIEFQITAEIGAEDD